MLKIFYAEVDTWFTGEETIRLHLWCSICWEIYGPVKPHFKVYMFWWLHIAFCGIVKEIWAMLMATAYTKSEGKIWSAVMIPRINLKISSEGIAWSSLKSFRLCLTKILVPCLLIKHREWGNLCFQMGYDVS